MSPAQPTDEPTAPIQSVAVAAHLPAHPPDGVEWFDDFGGLLYF